MTDTTQQPTDKTARSTAPTHIAYHVREVKDGYMMLSAPNEPDPTCSGANLMPAGKE